MFTKITSILKLRKILLTKIIFSFLIKKCYFIISFFNFLSRLLSNIYKYFQIVLIIPIFPIFPNISKISNIFQFFQIFPNISNISKYFKCFQIFSIFPIFSNISTYSAGEISLYDEVVFNSSPPYSQVQNRSIWLVKHKVSHL